MQLQQNLFSIYRLVLKTPKYVFLLSLGLLLIIAATQLTHALTSPRPLDFSQCLLQYVFQKHDHRANSTIPPNQSGNDSKSAEVITKTELYQLVDDRSLLNIQLGNDCHFEIDYDYKYNLQDLPVMFLTKNEHLAYLQSRPAQYLKRHNITYDRLVLPNPHISSPLFRYFYHQDLRLNELLMESLRQSIILLDTKFILSILTHNITQSKLSIEQLYLTYYFKDQRIHQRTVNMLQFISLRLISPLLLKLACAISMAILLFVISMIVGLGLRYSLIFLYTIFLLGYDKCMSDGWGWIHQNMSILYARFRQNRMATLKFMLFFIIGNIGMYGLLAFGTYCIINILIYPVLSFPSDLYTYFFLKCIFFSELFHYVFCRSRTGLRYFPIVSFAINYACLFIVSLRYTDNVTLIINLNCTLQLILFVVFLLVEQAIQEDSQKGMIGEYCPTINKPRMLFYAGYDISWEKSLPPIWTYFTNWFDYSYFNEAQKCLIEKDYQLLYGRMLGLNERQEIPEFGDEEQSEILGMRQQPSNEMNLIQNDL